jgi:hypothetical protein
MAVKHHEPIGRYVTIDVDGQQYKVFYLSNGKGTPLVCQHKLVTNNTSKILRVLFYLLPTSISLNFR